MIFSFLFDVYLFTIIKPSHIPTSDTLETIKRVDGTTLHFYYDSNKNITEIRAKQEASSVQVAKEQSLHYSYDTLGNLTQALNAEHAVILAYDEYANLTSESQGGYSLRRDYDANHQLQRLQFLDQLC